MTRIDEPIDVTVADGSPESFHWRDSTYAVSEVLESWTTEERKWWQLSRGEKRQYYRVHAARHRHRITVELYAVLGDKDEKWMLSVVFD